MSINERIKKVVKWLIGNGLVQNQEELGYLLGYSSKSSFSQILNAHVPIPLNFIDKICALDLNINKVWVESGEGEMLKGSTPALSSELKEKQYASHVEVRVVTTQARAGYSESYYADEYLKDMPTILIEADKEYKGKYLAFEINGDSMEPEYNIGDVVICREVKRDLWRYKLHYSDWDFVIAHGTKGIMLKQIIDHNVETGEITCHSVNTEQHPDFVLNLREVAFLYNVVEHRISGKNKRRYR